MNIKLYFHLWVIAAFSLLSCSEDNDLGNGVEPKTYNISGKVEKGPFVSGSTITIQPMDEHLQVLGSLFSSTIQDDLGNFSLGSQTLETPYAALTANGYFFHEVEGELSSGTLNLRGLVDLSDETTINVNLLTHLKYQRIQNLVADGMKFGEANKQAQKELFTAFGIQKYDKKDASTLSIAEGTDEAAAMIAISSLLLVDRSEAALTEYLAKLCREFAEKGTFEESTRQQMDKDKKALGKQLSAVRENIMERYEELGLQIEVKELQRFLDWDNDGIAGNETLEEGQEVRLETAELHVPNEGGTYTVGLSSPIPVYLTPLIETDDDDPTNQVTPESFFTEIYEHMDDDDISMEKNIDENGLTIKVSPLNSRLAKSASVQLYDCLGNVVGEVKILQEGNKDTSMPQLGKSGKQIVTAFASKMAEAFSGMNLMEQYYHYNKGTGWVNQYIHPNSDTVHKIWNAFYNSNRNIMLVKDAEAKQLGIYQDYFNVFSAMLYYYMVVVWGDVPYINYVPAIDHTYIARTPQDKIFADLKTNLEKAVESFEEKRNESLLADTNSYFFLSKDVARILLADICMYEGNYSQAEKLLEEIIDQGFYSLDTSNYNKQETITDLLNNGSSRETIFATRYEPLLSGNVSVNIPVIIPIITYTDVILSYAECLYKNGKTGEAEWQVEKITAAKSINVAGSNLLEKIRDARLQLMLYSNTNFAFMKRNNFALAVYGIEEYRQLLPIPMTELMVNPLITQNPGY